MGSKKSKSNVYILGVVGVIAIIGIAVMIIGANNPAVYGAASSSVDTFGQVVAGARSTAACVGVSSQTCSAGVGACKRTGTQTRTCKSGKWTTWSSCSARAGTPTTEICNNIDDNCNGLVDENLFQTRKCSSGVGYQNSTCRAGVWSAWSSCASKCINESNAAFCSRIGKLCGSVTAIDNCGSSRTISCGTCSSTQTCTLAGVCISTLNNTNISTLNTTKASYCGDKVCNGAETCSSCPADCGTCPSTCSGNSTLSCSIANGFGVQNRTCNSGTWSTSMCYVTSCTSGYFISGNTCVKISSTPLSGLCTVSPANGTPKLNVELIVQPIGGTGSYRYTWSYGDGTQFYTPNNSTTHIYNTVGTYNPIVNITDSAYKEAIISCGAITLYNPTTPVTACNDTDGGIFPFVKGTVYATDGVGADMCRTITKTGGSTTSIPIKACAGDTCYVMEFYCLASNNLGFVEIKCPYDCLNGACITTNTSLIQ